MSEQDLSEQVNLSREVKSLGRYRLLQRIGRGGMGDVWLAEDPALQRQVAVKTLPVQKQQRQDFVRLFEREARAAASLNHPHILQVHSYGRQTLADERVMPYIVMPYISHGSLKDRIDAYHSSATLLPAQEALSLLKQAAEAIDYAHKHHILHRDIKPANMLLRSQDWLMLSDFGIARIMSNSEQATRTGVAAGTPEYMAPEQAQGEATIVSDTYSLAIVAYQLFTGELPFQGDTAISTIMKHVLEEPPPPRQFNEVLSPAFEKVLLSGLTKDPAQRPALARDFIAQLERAYSDPAFQPDALPTIQNLPNDFFSAETYAIDESSFSKDPKKISRRNILLGSGASAAIIAGGGLGAWGYYNTLRSQFNLPSTPVSARPAHPGNRLPVLALKGYAQGVQSLGWSNDSRFLYSQSNNNVILRWNIPDLFQQPERTDGSPLYSQILRFPPAVLGITWSPDGTYCIIATAPVGSTTVSMSLYSADLKFITGLPSMQIEVAPSINTFNLYWLPNNYLVFKFDEPDQQHHLSAACHLYVIDLAQPRKPQPPVRLLARTGPHATCNGFGLWTSPDRSKAHFALLFDDVFMIGEIVRASSPTWHVLGLVNTKIFGGREFQGASFWPDGNTLVCYLMNTKTQDQKLDYFSWQDKSPHLLPLTLPQKKDTANKIISYNSNSLTGSTTSQNGKTFITMGRPSSDINSPGDLYIWDSLSTKTPQPLNISSDMLYDVATAAISPDNKWLAAGWDAATGESEIYLWQLGENI